MPELSYNKQQQKERPAVRQLAEQFLNEELRGQLEPFLGYIEENKFPFSLARCNTYESKYKSKVVFRLEIAQGQACKHDVYAVKAFTADDRTHFRDRAEVQEKLEAYLNGLDDDMKEYYLAHQIRCRGCGKCKPGVELDILGRRYKSLCASNMYVMQVTNPSESDYEMIKRFIAARREHIARG